VGATGEGTALYKRIFDNKDFPYPKPLSLILGLLDQATRPGDIILDFFAGSGTTGHAVLELNQRDNGQRSFILCSSTETSRDDPGRNICRDVCAERMRRVMAGYGNTPGLGGSFAYLRLDKFDPADAELDAEPQHIRQLLSLRFQGAAIAQGAQAQVDVLASSDDVTAVYLREVTAQSIAQLAALPTSRLIVFSNRPQTVLEMLPGKDIDSRSIAGEICAGQAGAPSNSFVQSASKAVAE
jgi:adenine-specific DNA-methyltransferase